MSTSSDYEISTDQSRFDIGLIHSFLASTYWAQGIPRSVVERSVRNSFCFGAFQADRQVAFARVITDYATFAYVADVFVVLEHRGHGVSKLLIGAILAHPDLQGLRRFLLVTKDAHGLYAQFGFKPITNPDQYMTIHNPDVYRNSPGPV